MGRHKEFWNGIDCVDVTTPRLVQFIEWRRKRAKKLKRPLTAHTLKKDFVTIRQILKHAIVKGMITTLPQFPNTHVVGKVKAN